MSTSRRDFLTGAIASAAFLPLVRGTSSLARAMAPEPELPLLTEQQLGHLRHIERLASLPDGEWAMMGSNDPGQEDLTAYRYQLAQMAYAVGLTHYHHLPAAPGLFRKTFDQLIHKMLRREVWSYWRETSRSGPRLDPGLKVLRDGWTDPVKSENIMYSGHLHAMVGMYATLFNDDKYDAKGSLTFRYDPIFYGFGPETYEYNHASLNQVIYDQMVASGWHGIPCEPNNVFIVCNQFPILGFRFFDIRKGTNLADQATAGYRAAWEKKGMLDAHGHVISTWMVRQDHKVDAFSGGFDAWAGSAMNAWNRDVVRARYPGQVVEWIERRPDGLMTLRSPREVMATRAARDAGRAAPPPDRTFPWRTPDLGYLAMWISEMGDAETLRGLLGYADRYMNPTWDRGALYYPRHDRPYDDAGNMTFMGPVTGNAMLAYARLNVGEGMWSLYNRPFGPEHFRQPALEDVSGDVDVLGAKFDAERQVIQLALRSRGGRPAQATLHVANVPTNRSWVARHDRKVIMTSGQERRDDRVRLTIPLTSRVTRLELEITGSG
ncbi:MAG: hypothetical protein IPF87_18340 [Gemmatimonadetes bacterium]|nr:hypothetical protein [Gemmatimonadota bacterium]